MVDKESKINQKGEKIDQNLIFSNENINVGHQPEFDYLKTLDIVIIVFFHFYDNISKGYFYNISFFLANILNAAGLMFLMGIGMKYSRHHETKNYFTRGIALLTMSQCLKLIRDTLPNIIAWWATGNKNFISRAMLVLQADILIFSGIAFLVLGLMKKMNLTDKYILIISVIMNLIAYPLFKIMKSPNNFLLSQFLGYFIFTDAEACFPFCSFFIFVAFGYWLGGYYQKISNKDKFYNLVLFFCLPAVIIYYYLRFHYKFSLLPDYYSFERYCLVPGPDAIATLMINFVILAIFYKIDRMLKGKTPEFIKHASKNLNQYYIISYIFIIQMQTFLISKGGEEYSSNVKYPTFCAFILYIFCKILIDLNDKYIHFTISNLKNPTRNFVFAFIWIMTIISVIYVYPKVEVYATFWNNYLLPL